MQLKDYQELAKAAFERFHDELLRQEAISKRHAAMLERDGVAAPPGLRDYPANTWHALTEREELPLVKDAHGRTLAPPYVRREDARGRPTPHVCLKIPTGGGKTLLGAHAVAATGMKNGLVLWITPSRAIFRQTRDHLNLREHAYRQILEHGCEGRMKLLFKDDQISRADLDNHLCVMPLMLQAADRQDSRDFLKIFRDTGKYPGVFPGPDDRAANQALAEAKPDLECHPPDDDRAPGGVKHSLLNLIKLARPMIVLDEAHNAYTENRRKKLGAFNPRLVVELSATPDPAVSNILVNIPGTALKDAEMIKLPIEIGNVQNADWRYALSEAHEKLAELETTAREFAGRGGDYIRPMMLIRVQRVGKDQRDGEHIHADDARDYLIRSLGVPPEHIRFKTSQKDEIAHEDLLSPYSQARYILTKDALREGWDCPFAYVLTLLDNTGARRALTQMTGRILRQPQARRTGVAALDRCYIYCFDQEVGMAVEQIKKGLESEGMGDLAGFIGGAGVESEVIDEKKTRLARRGGLRRMRVALPKVVHRDKGRKYRELDYDRDILGALDWTKVAAAAAREVGRFDRNEARLIWSDVDLPGGLPGAPREEALVVDKTPSLEFFARRLLDILPNSWIAAQVVEKSLARLRRDGVSDEDLYDGRVHISEQIKRACKRAIDKVAQATFADKLRAGEIRFEIDAGSGGFELPKELERVADTAAGPLFAQDGAVVKKALYENVFQADFNNFEKEFAVYLDGHEAVEWWHRLVARRGYALQGWRRERMYPDFVVCAVADGTYRMLILETKGRHLEGNDDTEYKKQLMLRLEESKPRAYGCGSIKLRDKRGARYMALRIMFEDSYKDDFAAALP